MIMWCIIEEKTKNIFLGGALCKEVGGQRPLGKDLLGHLCCDTVTRDGNNLLYIFFIFLKVKVTNQRLLVSNLNEMIVTFIFIEI